MSTDFNLDDLNELMNFVEFIFSKGKKIKGENNSVVGYWQWEDYRVVLSSTGDVIFYDDKNEKAIQIFISDRTKNNQLMLTRGREHRNYLIEEFFSWENREKIDRMKEEKSLTSKTE